MYSNSNRRIIHAFILLLVMLLQVGIKTFHVHHSYASVSIECDDCAQHRVHDGHLINWEEQNDECLLCQILANPYVPTEEIALNAVVEPLCTFAQDRQLSVCQGQWQSIRLRGPPSYLL